MKDAPLPPCPMCKGRTWVCPRCGNGLAAPPLPPEVVAVLKAISEYHDSPPVPVQLRIDRFEAYQNAISAWIAAGRPGLPAKTEKEK